MVFSDVSVATTEAMSNSAVAGVASVSASLMQTKANGVGWADPDAVHATTAKINPNKNRADGVADGSVHGSAGIT